jgi:phosphatidylglycerophosphate synthase
MLAASAGVAVGATGPAACVAIALAMAIALVLDTADGRLARLQGTGSAFGRWLDEFLDEMVDMALHAAIAWSAFARDGRPVWLLLGIAYASGKYLFRVQSSLGEELEGRSNAPHLTVPSPMLAARARTRGIAGLVRLLGHADLRWHLWIVLAAIGRLEIALAAYAIYFPTRTLAGAIRKGWRHG